MRRRPVSKPLYSSAASDVYKRQVWFTDGIFAEDCGIVEEGQKVFDLQGADWNQEIFPIIHALRSLLIRQGVPLAGAD